jgi:CheY-like chemotaxis protein
MGFTAPKLMLIRHAEKPIPAAMSAALDAEPWDLVISDWSLPAFNAPAALAVLKGKGLDLPFIIASGTIGEDKAVEAMRSGAHDFVLKGQLGRLLPAVERELRECTDRIAHRRAEHALRESEARFRRLSDSGLIGITISEIEQSGVGVTLRGVGPDGEAVSVRARYAVGADGGVVERCGQDRNDPVKHWTRQPTLPEPITVLASEAISRY